jgi:hypothetical protein
MVITVVKTDGNGEKKKLRLSADASRRFAEASQALELPLSETLPALERAEPVEILSEDGTNLADPIVVARKISDALGITPEFLKTIPVEDGVEWKPKLCGWPKNGKLELQLHRGDEIIAETNDHRRRLCLRKRDDASRAVAAKACLALPNETFFDDDLLELGVMNGKALADLPGTETSVGKVVVVTDSNGKRQPLLVVRNGSATRVGKHSDGDVIKAECNGTAWGIPPKADKKTKAARNEILDAVRTEFPGTKFRVYEKKNVPEGVACVKDNGTYLIE